MVVKKKKPSARDKENSKRGINKQTVKTKYV